jgi:hypothetical protein
MHADSNMQFVESEVMPWERISPPFWWARAGKYVVADRHLPDGTRQHMVQGHMPVGSVIDNAQVIGALDVKGARFASTLSDLSSDTSGH